MRSRCMLYLKWIGTFVLLLVLTGCSIWPFNTNGPAATPTPIASRPTPTDPETPAATRVANTDWTTYHYDNLRTGYLASAPDAHQLTRAWKVRLDGAVYAEPLVVSGHVLVVTEHDSIYSLDALTGKVQWKTSVGQPVPMSTLPCGDIDPLGITGTPVYDPQSGLLFAVAEVSGPAHILVGIDISDGHVRMRRSVDPPGSDPRAQQQRGALALSHGMIYITYGGLAGDCSDYLGWVVATRTDGKGPLLAYHIPTTRQGGIWTPPGPSIDAAGDIYVAVGNGAATAGTWDHSDSILRLSPTLRLEDGFAPTQWAQDNASDSDLGSMGPVLLSNGLVFADGKSGLGYLLHANALGGVGGQALVKHICRAFGGPATIGTEIILPCTSGVLQLQVGPGVHLTLGWHAPKQISGSPVIGGHMVYTLDPAGGFLYALDSGTGTVIARISVGTASRFATPSLSGNFVFVGTLKGVVAVAIS